MKTNILKNSILNITVIFIILVINIRCQYLCFNNANVSPRCFSEQCHNLINTTYKTSCKTGRGVEEMFSDIALQLVESNRSRIELQTLDHNSFKITNPDPPEEPSCSCWFVLLVSNCKNNLLSIWHFPLVCLCVVPDEI